MKLIITTPEKIVFEGDADKVNINTADGEITVLSKHISLISAVKEGKIRIGTEKGEKVFKNSAGVIEINQNKASVLLRSCTE